MQEGGISDLCGAVLYRCRCREEVFLACVERFCIGVDAGGEYYEKIKLQKLIKLRI